MEATDDPARAPGVWLAAIVVLLLNGVVLVGAWTGSLGDGLGGTPLVASGTDEPESPETRASGGHATGEGSAEAGSAVDDEVVGPEDDDEAGSDLDEDAETDEGSEPGGPDGADGGDDDSDDAEAPATSLAEVQQQLRDLGLLLGPVDGVNGQQTVAAVMAFQRINGVQVDGIVGPRTLEALESPAEPHLRGGPATRIEIDLTRQLLHLVENGRRITTMHVSSGNGRPYETSSGGTAYGRTPVGNFVIERRIAGVREADLGTLYDPLYFHLGWAVHGSNSVPAQPASHGCVRVTRADARWLFDRVPDGTPVQLYGGTHVFTPSR